MRNPFPIRRGKVPVCNATQSIFRPGLGSPKIMASHYPILTYVSRSPTDTAGPRPQNALHPFLTPEPSLFPMKACGPGVRTAPAQLAAGLEPGRRVGLLRLLLPE